jgi:hypothetical protein
MPSKEVERVFPTPGAAAETSAVLLDIHPSGTTLLVGTTGPIPSSDAATGATRLQVEELLLSADEAGGEGKKGNIVIERHSLGFRTSLRGWIRYARQGGLVEYVPPGADVGIESPVVHTFDKRTGTHHVSGTRVHSATERAGDLDVRGFLIPHAGSQGWDGFTTWVARDPASAQEEILEVVLSSEVLELADTPPVPIRFRSGRVLLGAGSPDAPLPVVASCGIQSFEAPRPGATRLSRWETLAVDALLFDPRWLEGAILARRDLSTEPLLLELYRSLRPARGGGSPLRLQRGESARAATQAPALFCVFEEVHSGGLDGESVSVEVLEQSPGLLRVERIRNSTVDPMGSDSAERSTRETLLFNGRGCWASVPGGRYVDVSPRAFVSRVNVASPFRLLIDPVRLGDPRLSFGKPRRIPGEGADLTALPFRYRDGFQGEFLLERTSGRLLPRCVRTPLFFETEALRRGAGAVPELQSVRFADWQPACGFLVPHRLDFDSGLHSMRLELKRLEWRQGVGSGVFLPPGGR